MQWKQYDIIKESTVRNASTQHKRQVNNEKRKLVRDGEKIIKVIKTFSISPMAAHAYYPHQNMGVESRQSVHTELIETRKVILPQLFNTRSSTVTIPNQSPFSSLQRPFARYSKSGSYMWNSPAGYYSRVSWNSNRLHVMTHRMHPGPSTGKAPSRPPSHLGHL